MISLFAAASAYGQGGYGAGIYGVDTIGIGPVQLPLTGATLWGILGLAALSAAVGLFVWGKRRRNQAPTA